MEQLTAEQIKEAKGKGFLRNRGTSCFSGRVISPGGVYTTEQLEQIAACAAQYGNGKIAFTTRLSAEIVGIPYENLEPATRFLLGQGSGLNFGGTGPKIRPITACKGTTCVFGCCDTQALAKQLHEDFYLGWSHTILPHKFKIAVGGCPNSCAKPSLNDFGLEAGRKGGETVFYVYLGGTWGRKTRREGVLLSKPISEQQVVPLLGKTLDWYQKFAQPGERLGAAIQRIGTEELEAHLAL